ncbi:MULTISPECIES: LLM class flavin-dependent oxidoreductase [unclassified Mycolicibacterium]|uniref:LLM class flavin-dependent oxidoreductase n=1 Tax=unclassified Mycolicibacterium TaxID=2636767 RepID=UPI0012DC60B7|nr:MULTISPECIES: LLM class flavin-dependent oxidoreductase [unclassified Mycolicibacterium]MUL85103.1 LLM class flavin-dependent oxidoreductase [Mycolicibacterium sp. CBMA 329]MUL91070.1 LLM class flavin-dependent oxidoreductase [Mycolicibacterium sp. CBMA 331]MUL98259.1 LLM class flavin-dependent oxidoreductase [Mycolicibacterium sp. CBMA 334]MUM26137.1 LLM class flavin-dependent oxidoreductase [Mycolicibacterium sp. CBMA 295]MUM40829.1 LLM class flavin-dependent oxidoreductase [Mycolicibacte
MVDIELACGLPPGPQFADLAVLAEKLGFARVWIFDSAPLWEDPFVHLALAAERTTRIGLATAVLIPSQRSVMTMASGIATIARLSGGRFRACFGTGATAHWMLGQEPMRLGALFDYVGSLRQLLAGETVAIDGEAVRMMHSQDMTVSRPVNVPLWLSVLGPRGNERAPEVADGIIGPPHPALPSATMMSGTVLGDGESPRSNRVLNAVGPWGVLPWHTAYTSGGAAAVDAMPGGAAWRADLEALAPPNERHLLSFEGHVTHLMARDLSLLEHLDVEGRTSAGLMMKVGDSVKIRQEIAQLAEAGYDEVIYTPAGLDVARELTAFAQLSH